MNVRIDDRKRQKEKVMENERKKKFQEIMLQAALFLEQLFNYSELKVIIETYKPDVLAIEELFYFKNNCGSTRALFKLIPQCKCAPVTRPVFPTRPIS